MLEKPSQKVLSALSSLDGQADYTVVMDWLKESLLALYTDTTRVQNEVLVRWNQGAAQVLEELIDKSKQAREIVSKSR